MAKRFILMATLLFFMSSTAQAGKFSDFLRSVFGTCFPLQISPETDFTSISKLLTHVYGKEKRKLSVQELTQVGHLLSLGADVEERDETWNSTPLMFAVQAVDLPLIALLLEHGANIRAQNGKYTIINYIRSLDDMYQIARTTKSIPLVVSFIEYRESRDLTDSEFALLKEIIENGAQVDETTADGKTAFMIAQEKHDFLLMRFLRAYSRL